MISKAEMKSFLMSLDGEQMKDNNFETLFDLVDEDDSSEVDFAEFSAFMGHIKENIDAHTEKFVEA